MAKPDYIEAHQHASEHEKELSASENCGCFHCVSVFEPSDIVEWIEEQNSDERTALCPFCEKEAVIGEAAGFPITVEFLEKMRKYWFAG